MIKKKIPKELKNECWNWLQSNNMGNRSEFNGKRKQQLGGLIGEIMVKQLFRIEHEWKNGFDGGFDFEYKGKKIDVKTQLRKTDVQSYYVNNVYPLQFQNNFDVYLFASVNEKKSELTICGWIYKSDVLKLVDDLTLKLIPKGTTIGHSFLRESTVDSYGIGMEHLNDIKTPW